jgi:dCTP deaminase
MPVLPDNWISDMARRHKMIVPFARPASTQGKISFGLSSYGYDFRLFDEYKIPDFKDRKALDPKDMNQNNYRDFKGRCCMIAANSFVLARSLEYFRIPRDVLVICYGKSTYARCGVFVNVTPLEPEWEGFITISIANLSPVPVKVHSGEGIGQAVFIRAERECTTSYADKKGKYQAQKKIQVSRV